MDISESSFLIHGENVESNEVNAENAARVVNYG